MLDAGVPWPGQPIPNGGTGWWLTGPVGYDTSELLVRARRRGILFQPGASFYLDEPAPTNHLRLGLNAIPVERVRDGLELLFACV